MDERISYMLLMGLGEGQAVRLWWLIKRRVPSRRASGQGTIVHADLGAPHIEVRVGKRLVRSGLLRGVLVHGYNGNRRRTVTILAHYAPNHIRGYSGVVLL